MYLTNSDYFWYILNVLIVNHPPAYPTNDLEAYDYGVTFSKYERWEKSLFINKIDKFSNYHQIYFKHIGQQPVKKGLNAKE